MYPDQVCYYAEILEIQSQKIIGTMSIHVDKEDKSAFNAHNQLGKEIDRVYNEDSFTHTFINFKKVD
jgi:hypothetical protein